MYTLGIETSCDETAAAVLRGKSRVLSSVVVSSLRFHKKYGGVIPEIASRKQLETITSVVDCSLKEAKIGLEEVRLLSVTNRPGLLGSLLVGIAFARSLSLSLGIPLLGIDHLYSHIYANFLNKPGISLPSIALVVSGGHTSLFYVKDPGQVKTLGATLDDACGESFDKVAKILGLGYPGGPLIERLAKKGDPGKIKFNCSATRHPFDFSFSGIKTAVLYHVRGSPRASSVSRVPYAAACDIAASFQESVIGALVKKSLLACKIKKMPRLIIGGGVAANSRLRERFFHQAKKEGVSVSFPPLEFCTDNAAMVAGLGSWLFTNGQHSGLGLSAAT